MIAGDYVTFQKTETPKTGDIVYDAYEEAVEAVLCMFCKTQINQ